MNARQSASPTGHRNIIVQAVGDGINIGVEIPKLPTLELVPVEARLRGLPKRDIDILDPASQAVPLVGRDLDLRFFQGWLTSERKIAVTALVGSGGSGKTRLAMEILQGLPSDWQGGLLTSSEARRFVSQENASRWSWQRPTLIVVDYAAGLADTLAKWLSELADHSPSCEPLRVLLLERHADTKAGWYRNLADSTWHGRAVRDLFSPSEPRQITPLNGIATRRELLISALNVIASLSQEPVAALPEFGEDALFEQRLSDEQWANPLLLLMAAITAASNGIDAALHLSRPDLAKLLASRERDRIKHLAGDRDRTAKDLLAHLYACVTLCGGLSLENAAVVADIEFKALRKAYACGPGQAVDDLASVLGGQGFLHSATPDLLAEALLLVTLGDRGADVVKRLASTSPSSMAEILVRTVLDFAPEGDSQPVEWLRSLIAMGETDLPILMAIEAAIPIRTLVFREVGLRLTESLIHKLEQTRNSTWPEHLLAKLWNDLSLRHHAMGQREQALSSIKQAVRYFRQLAEIDPEKFLPNLAVSLNNQANWQIIMGQRAESAASVAEAVLYCRQLTRTHSNTFRPLLATSLNSHANVLISIGRPRQALDSIVEAVGILRQLAEWSPDEFLFDLANSLNDQGNVQSAIGQRGGALASIAEAVRIRRDLAQTNPDAFLPDLGRSLMNYANALLGVGQRREALDAATEAVVEMRRLAEANRHAFLSDLAQSIMIQATMRIELGNLREALASVAESVTYYRELVEASPDAFLADLAKALNNLAKSQRAMGYSRAALTSMTEAVAYNRRLSETEPDTFLPELAKTLINLSTGQRDTGEREAALASIVEAVGLNRQLAENNPEAYLPVLAASLNNLSITQSDIGKKREALAASAEAVDIRRELTRTNRGAFLPDLARSLNNHAKRYLEMGQQNDAVETINQAVRDYRELAQASPEAFQFDLARALAVLGDCLASMGRILEAHDAAEESLQLLTRYFNESPEAHGKLAQSIFQDYQSRCLLLKLRPDKELVITYARSIWRGIFT